MERRKTMSHPQKWPLARMGRRSGGWVFAERAFFSANEVKTRSRRARCVRPLEAVRMENLLLRFIPPKAALGSSRSHGHGRPWLFRPYRLQRASDNDGMPGQAGHDCRRRRWRDARLSRMRRLTMVRPAAGRYGESHCLAASRTVHLCHPFRVQKTADPAEIRPRQAPSSAPILLASTPTPQHNGRVPLSTPQHGDEMPGHAGHEA